MSDKRKAAREDPVCSSSRSSHTEVDRHRDRVVAAETHRLERELRTIAPMPRDKLAEICHTDRWTEGSLDQAVRAGVRTGKLRVLPLGWVAAGDDRADSPPDKSA